ncbi:YrbL family protein [Vibrio sp. YIC-376]|uniref:YrbL family protein n=1 Tax=Vibrio sp. YIC-376 TaxID=3136162 RepID=UPI00402AC491
MQSDHEFQNWTVIGKGAERVCFQNPSNPAQCVKLSQKSAAKQTYREIQFFERLKKKNVQFTHIPEFLGKVTTETQVGFKQQVVLDEDLSVSLNFAQYIVQQGDDLDMDNMLLAVRILKDYLLESRVIPSDLVMTNILVRQSGDEITLYLIDGFGNTEFIPVSDFIPYLMHKKINRKFKKFLRKNLHLSMEIRENSADLESYNQKIDEFEALYL